MPQQRKSMTKKILLITLVLFVVLSTLLASAAYFTDRESKSSTIKVSTFDADGFSVEQITPSGSFVVEGETLEIQLNTGNSKDEDIEAQITMKAEWDSPEDGVYPWGNDDSSKNLVITVGGETVDYTIDGDTILIELPSTILPAGSDSGLDIEFHIPSDLDATGTLHFSYEDIEISQSPSGWTTEYDDSDLSDLSFDIEVVWDVSNTPGTKDVVAYLTESTSGPGCGLAIEKIGSDNNANNGAMKDWSGAGETPWSDITLTELSIDEGITNIGDYAFSGQSGITSVDIPSSVTDIGHSAFNGTGLSGTLVIPASVNNIDYLAFANLTKVDTIVFEHGTGDNLTIADNTASGKSTSGAFYAGSSYSEDKPLGTKIVTDKEDILDYAWNIDARGYTITIPATTGVSIAIDPSTAVNGQTISLTITPEDGYEYNGATLSWGSESKTLAADAESFTMPAGNVTLTPDVSIATYTITYNLNGGTQGSNAITSYNKDTATFSLPTPTKAGYTFSGWYESNSFSGSAVTEIVKGSTGNKTFYAKWTANTNTAYTVKHWQQTLTGGDTQNSTNYVVKDTESKTGTTGASITPSVKNYTGFKAPSTQTVTIAADGSTVVNYYYTRNSYTFTLGSGTGVSTTGSTASGSYKYGATITLKASASSGYTWTKWTSSNASLLSNKTDASTTFTMPAGAVTMTPSTTVNTYTITYNLNGGTQGSDAATSYTVATATITLPTPTKTGYTFGGWYTASDLSGTAVTQIAKGSTGNKTFYAKWTASTGTSYTVKHWQQTLTGGDTQNSTNYAVKDTESKTGTTGASVTPSVKSYTGFTAPATQTVTIAADGSTVVNYYYTRNSYTFTLGSDAGVSTSGSTSSGSYKYGATITLEASANAGYTWTKWTSSNTSLVANKTDASTTFTMPAGNVTMTPSATENTYTITYNLNGGTQGSSAATSYTVTTATITLPSPTKTGYTFGGWYTASDLSGTAVTQIAKGSTGNKTFYAKWTANSGTSYTVKHWQQTLTGGDTQNSTNYAVKDTENKTGTTGASVTPSVKSYTGFTAPATQTVTIAADGSTVVNYYYTRNSYTFTLGSGTGVSTSGSTSTGSYKYGATITLKASANSGYTWSKWTSSNTSLVASTTTSCTTFTMPAGAVTMTPSATVNTYTITYNLNGGTQGSNAATSYTVTTATITLPTPTKTGYTFGGWYTASDLSGTAVTQIAKGSTGNKTFYAKWTANTNTAYTVKHWQQTLTGGDTQNSTNYAVKDTESKTGTTAASVTPSVKSYTGFTAPSTQTVTIAADGSTVVNYYYTRNSYTFTLGSGTGVSTSGSTSSGSYKYGATITLKASATSGYTWSKWTSSNTSLVANTTTASTSFTMPAGNVTMTPSATADTYTITYNLNGGTQGSNAATSYTIATSTITLPTPTRSRYTFGGWYESADFSGSNVTQIAKGSTGNKTFYAKWEKTGEAFAVYSESDNSLTFYHDTVPSVGSTYEGKTATAVYTGFETETYTSSEIPWYDVREDILSVSFEDEITPVSTKYWFFDFFYVKSFDVGLLDTSNVTSMDYMFSYCNVLTSLDVSNFDTSKVTSMARMFHYSQALTSLDLSNFDTSQVTNMAYMFSNCPALTSLDVSSFDTSNVTNMESMFSNCGKLRSLDVSQFDTSKVKYMAGMFNYCSSLTSLDITNFDTNKVTTMNQMFASCTQLTSLDLSSFNTSKVYNMISMFEGDTKLTTIYVSSGWTTAAVSASSLMFDGCTSLVGGNGTAYVNVGVDDATYARIDKSGQQGFLTGPTAFAVLNSDGSMIFYSRPESTVPSAGDTFEGKTVSYVYTGFESTTCTSSSPAPWYTERASIKTVSFADVIKPVNTTFWFYGCSMTFFDGTNLDTSEVQDMSYMFRQCESLTNIDLSGFNTSSLTNTKFMFYGCKGLASLDMSSFDTSGVTDMSSMFQNCSSLTSLDLSNFDTGSVTSMDTMFGYCSKLASVDVSSFDTSSVTKMGGMFRSCSSLKTLDLSSFDTSSVANISYMFYSCSKLTTIYVSDLWSTAKVSSSTSMFHLCTSLSGAISYASGKVDATYANYTDGYLTYKAAASAVCFSLNPDETTISSQDQNQDADCANSSKESVSEQCSEDKLISDLNVEEDSSDDATQGSASDDSEQNTDSEVTSSEPLKQPSEAAVPSEAQEVSEEGESTETDVNPDSSEPGSPESA